MVVENRGTVAVEEEIGDTETCDCTTFLLWCVLFDRGLRDDINNCCCQPGGDSHKVLSEEPYSCSHNGPAPMPPHILFVHHVVLVQKASVIVT